ncbi:hypothetical protein ZEAMMB73_Zm00001d028977 [Zea mays]|uniref:Uncharacterized protein n=1 Tax=Zea mays TaxID=4577 RepID=A0A1D6K179_MAIZE|nr:hypothetical protein ZEAMMB73_Zm00001d028977 [Zea mays]
MIARAEDAKKRNRKLHVDLTTVQAHAVALESREVIDVEALKQAKDEHVQKLMEAYLVTHNQRRALRIQEPASSNPVQPMRAEDPQILEGHPVSIRGEKKAWELPEGAIVLEGIPVFPQAMNKLFDDYRDEDFYGLPQKYCIVARGAKIEAITYMYETVKHFDNLLHEKHVYKMHNVKFGLHPGEFNFRHLNGLMELCLNQQTIVEPYNVPIQMASFPKQIFLNLADIAELPNRTLVGGLYISLKFGGDLLNKNALRWALAKEDYGIIIRTMFRRFRRQECLEPSDHTAIHFNPFHHNTHYFGPIQKALMAWNNRQFAVTFLEEQRRR